MLQVNINGHPYKFDGEPTVLEALRSINIYIPTACHDYRLKPYGGCRLCIVKIDGYPRPVTACNTELLDGMKIETDTPEIESLRTTLLKMLAKDYPAEAIKSFPEKEFHKHLIRYGLDSKLNNPKTDIHIDRSHPYIEVNMLKCIYCYRCVRICEEVQGQFVWQVFNRGNKTRIVPDSGTTFFKSSCVSCGACADSCPTGALEDKSIVEHGIPTKWTKTTCPYCGVGCEIDVGTKNDRIISTKPSNGPSNKGHLCIKGRYAFDFVHADDRVTKPMIRENGGWKEVTWKEALQFTAKEFNRMRDKYGPDSLGVLASSRATNEENHITQKFARLVLGTNNVDNCARVCHNPSAAALKTMLGAGASTNALNDIERAKTIMICGTNTTENHPVTGARIKQATIKGAKLIVLDPRRIELADYADIHLASRPGSNIPVLHAMANTIIEEKLYDEEFINNRVSEWEEFRKFVKPYTTERAEKISGIKAELIRQAARIYATNKPSMLINGLGMTEHIQGTEGVMCLINLALITGNLGVEGAGVNPLRGQNNVQGAGQMGAVPTALTGGISIKEGKALFEKIWGGKIPESYGLNLMQMLDAAMEGKFKGMWVIGYDILLSSPNTNVTRKAFEKMECVVIQDLFMNETAREFGTIFLPVTSSYERDGTFMNGERRVQLIRKAIEPIGDSKPDWEVICELAKEMKSGHFFNFSSPKDIWEEIRKVWPAAAGITYERLEKGGLQWPCPTENHPGTEVLHQKTFTKGERASLQRIKYTPTKEKTSNKYPLLLNTGRNLYQFNAFTMTGRTKNNLYRPIDLLDISPNDAKLFKLKDGERAKIMSRYGEAIIPVNITNQVKPGELFATFHNASIFLNLVTGPYRDNRVDTPEYKVTAVQLEKTK